VRRYIEKMSLKEFDRHAGALLGAITGVILCVSVTLFSVTMLKENQRQYIVQSKSGLYITKWINEFEGVFPPAVHQVLSPYIKRLNEEMGYGTGSEDQINPTFNPYQPFQNQAVNSTLLPNQGNPNAGNGFVTQPGLGTSPPAFPDGNNPGGFAPAVPAGYNGF